VVKRELFISNPLKENKGNQLFYPILNGIFHHKAILPNEKSGIKGQRKTLSQLITIYYALLIGKFYTRMPFLRDMKRSLVRILYSSGIIRNTLLKYGIPLHKKRLIVPVYPNPIPVILVVT
jgi:hypothetical protein